MAWETRTDWVYATEITTDDDIAGFGPINWIRDNGKNITFGNIYGSLKTVPSHSMVQRYLGVWDGDRRISLTVAEMKEQREKELAERRAGQRSYSSDVWGW